MEVQINVTSREVIKPDSSSPRDHIQLSIVDLMCPGMYLSTIFFYKAEDLINVSPETFSENLKNSLSKTLSRFYPFAGRIKGTSISCNDEGAVFNEAHTDLLLHDFFKNIDNYSLQGFLSTLVPEDSASEWPLLSVKVTFLGSRSGVAVSVSISHKICDAASLVTFAKEWATNTAKGKSNDVVDAVNTIEFAETTIYPPPHNSIQLPSIEFTYNNGRKCVMKRLVFESSKITELKHKAASEIVPEATRVEVISSLIWRCALRSTSNLVVPKSTVMYQAMDLRLRIPTTVLARDAIGNLQAGFNIKNNADDELKIHKIVASFRKVKEEVNEVIQESLQSNTIGHNMMTLMKNSVSDSPDIDNYVMTSWCRKPFYEVDFGFGGPVWIGIASHTIYHSVKGVILIDSKDGVGVEAWISFPEQDMSVFVCDQELLAYAVLNPPVLT